MSPGVFWGFVSMDEPPLEYYDPMEHIVMVVSTAMFPQIWDSNTLLDKEVVLHGGVCHNMHNP